MRRVNLLLPTCLMSVWGCDSQSNAGVTDTAGSATTGVQTTTTSTASSDDGGQRQTFTSDEQTRAASTATVVETNEPDPRTSRPSGGDSGAGPNASVGPNASAGPNATADGGLTTSSAALSSETSSADTQQTVGGSWNPDFPTFTRHEIATFQSGYYTVVTDVDGDDKPDVVALSSGNAGLVWYKNPNWEQFKITTATERFICVAAHDVDGDGDVDLAIASEFSMNDSNKGGTIYLAEAPDDPTTNQEWTLHPVDAVPTSHRVRFGDVDGDGTKELLNLPIFGIGSSAPERAGAVQFKAYTVPSVLDDAWAAQVIDDSLLEVAHGFSVVDWDGDAAQDLLTATNAGVHLFRPSLGVAPTHLGIGKDGARPDRGSSEVSLGTLGGERFIATIEPWHGTDTVIYTPASGVDELWTREVLGADFQHGHALVTVDLNADGYDEIVGGGGEGDRAQLIYRYLPDSNSWEKLELDIGGVAVAAIDIADINGDGALDIVTIGGSPTNNLVWYENVP